MTDFKPEQGQRFDPVEASKNGYHPADVVDARLDLGDGPKRLYSRLYRLGVTPDRRRHPWRGFVYPSVGYLAKLLGKSERGVQRDSAELRDDNLIEIGRPNRTEFNRYYFLWKREFDTTNSSSREPSSDTTDSSSRGKFPESAESSGNPPRISAETTDMTQGGDRYDAFETTDPSRAYKEDLGVDLGVDLKDEHQDGSMRSHKTRASRRSQGAFIKIPIPKNQLGNEQSTWTKGITAREALRDHLASWGLPEESGPPDDSILENIMEAGTRYGATVDEITEMCDSKIAYSSPHRTRTQIRSYPAFVTITANHFRVEKQKTQGLAHATDSRDPNDPEFRAMSECF